MSVFSARVTPEAVRQAIFFLGGRHHGNALGGARLELLGSGLTMERRRLLEAVILHLSPGARPAAAPLFMLPTLDLQGFCILAAIIMAAMTVVWLFF